VWIVLGVLLICGHSRCYGQILTKIDSIKFSNLHFTRNKFINNVFEQAVNSVKRTPDSGPDDSYLNGKSEDPYLPYQGKIVRHIFIDAINFDQSFDDTTSHDHSFAARMGNALHRSTRDFVIRNDLFVERNRPLNAFKLADNERYLRSLEYIHDARIIVDSIPGNPDSVDIRVYTKDVFSIGGGGSSNGLNHFTLNAYDANLLGMAQRLDLSGLYDYTRDPGLGYGGFYRKDNVGGSFIDATVGYSTINVSGYTHEEETDEYLTLTRQLVSPYSRFAGGLTISHDQAYNPYSSPDSITYRYNYSYFDGWAGYNIGIKQLTATNNAIRDRRFLAFRYYNRDFTETPVQVGKSFNPIFNSSQAVLATMTFFSQDYYKTQYIYGFGTTEDLPYGYNVAVTAGWHKQLDLQRPYAGVNASRYIATGYGDFIQLYMRSGAFLDQNKVQDGSFLIGATAFSRIFFINSTKIRQYINASYTQIYNRLTYAPLYINNYFGPRGFLADSAYGDRRVTVQLETEFYLHFKFLGFQFAPFPYADVSLLTPVGVPFLQSSLYSSLGGGVRARNENLIFQTIEMRAFFFPVAPNNMRGFKIVITSNVRYKYTSNYVVEPDLVQLNTQ
jgi:hypothetical protein